MIEHGHADPASYTPAQINLFIEAIARRERKERRDSLREAALAHRIGSYSDDAFNKQMRKLREKDE